MRDDLLSNDKSGIGGMRQQTIDRDPLDGLGRHKLFLFCNGGFVSQMTSWLEIARPAAGCPEAGPGRLWILWRSLRNIYGTVVRRPSVFGV